MKEINTIERERQETASGRIDSRKSFRPKDGSGELPTPGRNGELKFCGEPRSNQTHASTTDADARV